MDRRTLLKASFALTASSAASMASLPARAQADNVIDEILDARPWLDPEVYMDFRRLSAALIELRIVYNGPGGYEGEDAFISGIWDVWYTAFGTDANPGFAAVQSRLVPALDGGLADQLENQMTSLLSANVEDFIGWLDEIGVEFGSPLQVDFLRAQAFFAVAAAVFDAGGDLSAYANFTWVFPFC